MILYIYWEKKAYIFAWRNKIKPEPKTHTTSKLFNYILNLVPSLGKTDQNAKLVYTMFKKEKKEKEKEETHKP